MQHTIFFSEAIKTNKSITEFKGTGKFWIFNNGQYGEKIEHLEAQEFYLSYHYGRVYLNRCTRHGSQHGATSGSCQGPLTINDKPQYKTEIMDIAAAIFAADIAAGIIPKEYKFI